MLLKYNFAQANTLCQLYFCTVKIIGLLSSFDNMLYLTGSLLLVQWICAEIVQFVLKA